MPPRFAYDVPAPTPNPPSGLVPQYVPPATVPGQGPTFGGSDDADPRTGEPYPRVGVGWRGSWGGSPVAPRGEPDFLSLGAPRGEVLETQPAPMVLRSLFDMPKPELVALQTQMYDAGYYGDVAKDAIVFGSVDDRTWEAYGSLLQQTAQYNSAGRDMTWFELLDETQRLRKEQGTNLLANQGPKRAPFVGRTTASEDIERIAQHVATSLTGENVDPGLVRSIIAQYQASEVSAQRQAYGAEETGGVIEGAPSVEAFAAEQIEEANPLGTQAYAVADRVVGSFLDVIGSPFDG